MMPIRSHFKSVRDPGRSIPNIRAPRLAARSRGPRPKAIGEARTQLAELVAEIDAALATLTDELGD
jgi:hypothetical protein